MQIILMERVESLGDLGDVVSVKPGYARNYLLPQSKAIRATKDNIAYFEKAKSEIEKKNAENRKAAEKRAKNLEGLKVTIVRLGSESGQLYGSVTAKDIAAAISEQSKEAVENSMVNLNRSYKTIGLFPVPVVLHPEVTVEVTVNIARSEEEAKIQAKTGKALLADDEADNVAETSDEKVEVAENAEKAKEVLLEEGALEAEKAKAEEEAEKAAEKAKKSQAKSEARAAKKAEMEKAEEEAAEEAESAESTEEAKEESEESES
jgi:large subunit ribosomal protein L9